MAIRALKGTAKRRTSLRDLWVRPEKLLDSSGKNGCSSLVTTQTRGFDWEHLHPGTGRQPQGPMGSSGQMVFQRIHDRGPEWAHQTNLMGLQPNAWPRASEISQVACSWPEDRPSPPATGSGLPPGAFEPIWC